MCVSVLILTLNEQENLSNCLDSVSWSDDVVVFDSYSTDRTIDIAREKGARVFQREFDNYASQRNAALNEVKYKYSWVLMVDADERWNKHIFDEIGATIVNNAAASLYHFRRRDVFMGRWLRHTGYPTWAGRLVKLGEVTVSRSINEEYNTAGGKGYLKSHFIHYPFNKGFVHWFHRHNRYSTMEAEALIKEASYQLHPADVLSLDPLRRRKCLKRLAYRLPFRPFLVFCYLYLLRRGFLDGAAGLNYCRLRAVYEYMIDMKIKELRRRREGLTL